MATMQSRQRLHGPAGWGLLLALVAAGAVFAPILNLALAPEHPLHLPDYMVPLLGKFACYAIAALALDLIWGFAGILSLGHGVFFALGGYAMAMHLSKVAADAGLYRTAFPPFMEFLRWDSLPWFWFGFEHFAYAMVMVLLLPGALALIFGYLAFRSRIRGVYFAIITQAMTFALMLLLYVNEAGLGGNNGLTDFKILLGFPLAEQPVKVVLYVVTVLALAAGYLLCRWIVTSPAGRVLIAIRDAEDRVMFSGYNPLHYKLFAWTVSAMLCAVGGALYVLHAGIINPGELEPAASIEMAIWVAVGGRGTLGGAILGAGVVNGAKSYLTAAWPDLWLFFLGGLFVAVTLFLPKGLVGLRLPALHRTKAARPVQVRS